MKHRITRVVVSTVAAALLALPLAAAQQEEATAEHAQAHGQEMSAEDQAMMQAYMAAGTPGAEHQRLAESAGAWKSTVRMWMGPGEPQVSEATSTREMILDGRVLTETFAGAMMGMPFTGHGMVGYDNARKMYWSTWNDSMSTSLMTAWGKWDDAQGALVMEGEMTHPESGERVKIKEIVRYPQPGTEVFEMWEPHGPGGEMVRTMEITSVKQ